MKSSHLTCACVALILCVGCSRDNSSDSAAIEYDATLSTLDLMHLVIEPAADVLWDSAGWIMTLEEEYSLVPTTDEGWFVVESAAGVIIESGDLLKIPQRSTVGEASWFEYASDMTAQAIVAREAVIDRDGDALFEAGAALYQSCVRCHDEYWVNR